MLAVAAIFTGGCQCGAVRYEMRAEDALADICHCRMCQRASGQPFMAFVKVKDESVRFTAGAPSVFSSSNIAERGFCRDCGTPLTYRRFGTGDINITLCSLDEPGRFAPAMQFGVQSKLAWVDAIAQLPQKTTDAWRRDNALPVIESHQQER